MHTIRWVTLGNLSLTVPAKNDIDRVWTRTFSCYGNANQLMAAMQGNMNEFAGNRGTIFASDFPSKPLRLGGRYVVVAGLNAYNGGEFPTGILDVKVTSQSPTGWTFTTNPAQHYFDGTVSFSASNAGNGNVTFAIGAKANFSSQLAKYTIGWLIKAGENATWNSVLDHVQSLCQGLTF